jgi:hypothetical protein
MNLNVTDKESDKLHRCGIPAVSMNLRVKQTDNVILTFDTCDRYEVF